MATSPIPFQRAPRGQPAPTPVEPPSDIEAERAVLGSVLLNRDAILVVREWLVPDRFYLARHQQIYDAMLSLVVAGTPPDTRLVAGELKVRGQLDAVGGLAYLTELIDSVPTSYHIEHYATLVDTLGWLRDLIAAGGRIAALGYAGDADAAALAVEQMHAGLLGSRHHGPAPTTESVTDLWGKSFPDPVWVIEGLLLEGLTLFSGKPKMGKGLIVTNLAAAVASGGKALGVADVLQGDVLYLALEDPEAEIQARFERALGGRPSIPLHYKMRWRPIASGGLSDLERWLTDHPNARLIVIDTFSALAPEEDGKKSAYRADYTALRPLQQLAAKYPGLAIIAVTHNRKAGADDVLDEMSGTTGKSGAVDHVWIMRRQRGENVAELHGELRRAASWARQILFDPHLASWRLGDDAAIAKAAGVRVDVLDALLDDEAWPKDLAETIDADRAQVRKQLGILRRQGLVEKGERGRYRLTESGRLAASPDPVDQRIRGSDLTPPAEPPRRPKSVWRDWDAESSEGEQAEQAEQLPLADPPRSDPGSEGDQTWSDPRSDPGSDLIDQLLRPAPPQQRFFVRMYLRSTRERDQAIGRAKCAEYGIDYAALYTAIQGHPPDETEEV